MPPGRPTSYTPEIADEICAQLSEGVSLRKVCEADHLPCKATIFNWMRTNDSFLDQYARAKEEAADSLTDEILEIADDARNDYMEKENEDNNRETWWEYKSEHVQRSRLRIDSRKWLASKLKPKKYGDKLDLTSKDEKISTGVIAVPMSQSEEEAEEGYD